MIEIDTNNHYEGARIKVIGIGGGGGNAINNMIRKGLTGVEFIAANTDRQALEHNLASVKIQIGRETTRGLGAGANPEVGHKSVEESKEQIKEALKGSDMLFITSGMGGGTGTGGAPIVAKIGQELGALVVGIVTTPFSWEGKKRFAIADEWITELRKYVDALIVIPNQRLLEVIDKNTTFQEAFLKVDEVLYNATRGIADIISEHGEVNVDFADVVTIMKGMGDALMGIGNASGESRAAKATHNALNSPLLNNISINGSKGVLVNITAGPSLTMHEISEVVSIVEQAAGGEVLLIHGICRKEDLNDELMVTVVATGFAINKESEIIEVKNEVVVEEITPIAKQTNNFQGFKAPMPITRYTPETLANGLSVENAINNFAPRSPKGVPELKKFEQPAMTRRNVDAIIGEPIGVDRSDKPGIPVSFAPEHKIKFNDQPAFIRRLLD